MSVEIYLWTKAPDHAFRRVGEVRVEGPAIAVVASEDPEIATIIEHLRAVPELPLTIEQPGEPGRGPLAMSRIKVATSDARYGYAVAEALGKLSPYRVSLTPEAPTF